MASNEEIMDKLDVIQRHFIGVETTLEEIRNVKPETVEMNERDRSILLSNISAFEGNLSENIKNEIIRQQTDFKAYQREFSERLVMQNNQNKKEAEDLFLRAERTAKSVGDLSSTVKASVDSGFSELKLKDEIEKIMTTSIKDSLEKQTKANEQAVIRLGNTAVQMRETFRQRVPKSYSYISILLVLIAGLLGFTLHAFYQSKYCENVFEQFYQDRYDREISEPMRKAEKEAEDFLNDKKQEASNYLEQQKKDSDSYSRQKRIEADEYLKERIAEADKKADEEYELRLNAYVENAKKEASKTMKNNKSEEGN